MFYLYFDLDYRSLVMDPIEVCLLEEEDNSLFITQESNSNVGLSINCGDLAREIDVTSSMESVLRQDLIFQMTTLKYQVLRGYQLSSE